jgi:hypothetical protein
VHVTYVPENTEYWVRYYEASIKNNQYQLGGELDGFRAAFPFHQRGAGLGSFFKSLLRMAMPLFKSAGKHALVAGSKIATDVSQGKAFKESFSEHGREAAGQILHETADRVLSQKGKGLGIRKRKKASTVNAYKKNKLCNSVSFSKKKLPRTVGFPDIYSRK